MKIILAEHFGMCFGVRDAIAQAEKLAEQAPLTILGELVHNPVVRDRLRAQGVGEATTDEMNNIDIASNSGAIGMTTQHGGRSSPQSSQRSTSSRLPGRGGPAFAQLRRGEHAAQGEGRGIGALGGQTRNDRTPMRVMITAHGASDTKRAIWHERGLLVADGTCPLVRHAHEQLKRLVAAGYFPVVIGKSGHVEVRGLTEDFPDAHVVDLPGDISKLPLHDRYGVISQTTQPIDRVRSLVAEIERLRPASEVRFVDTVCKPTKDRQSALRKLIDVAEIIIVVGGRESNNTRQLVETCRAAGRSAFHIERPEELRAEWLDNISVVGLTAGTSTLPETVDSVFRRLEEIARTRP
jgi:4-hydroxy-3-methylbut-2-enyl diphosphate reductase